MDADKNNLALVHEILSKNKCHYSLIYSHQNFLDVLPYRASKGKAIRYLSNKWDIPLDSFLVCGDSGNDEEMLRGEPKGVIVANHSIELEPLRGKRKIYFSQGTHATGILEGIKYYDFMT
jgi:sucrose-phosphate synthase